MSGSGKKYGTSDHMMDAMRTFLHDKAKIDVEKTCMGASMNQQIEDSVVTHNGKWSDVTLGSLPQNGMTTEINICGISFRNEDGILNVGLTEGTEVSAASELLFAYLQGKLDGRQL